MQFTQAKIFVQGNSKSKTFRFPVCFFLLSKVLRYFVCLGLLLLLFEFGFSFFHNYFLENALAKRNHLQNKLVALKVKTDSLNLALESSFEKVDLLYAKAGLLHLDHATREFGTGGTILPEDLFLRSISKTAALTVDMREASEKLKNKTQFNKSSLQTIASILNQKQEATRFIPTIAPAKGRYASSFGRRVHPVTGVVGKMHYGIDISNSTWTPIYATADGYVDVARVSSSFGKFVSINHGNGFLTKYGHMVHYLVKEGQFVSRYQIIGYMGNTGRSTGSHLHYEVWQNGNAVNPLAYILPNDYAIE